MRGTKKIGRFCRVLGVVLLVALIFAALAGCAGPVASEALEPVVLPEISEMPFKVVGYYSGELFDEPIEKLQADKLTHVIYAFLIPKEDGSIMPLEKPEQLKAVVEKCASAGTKVYIAVGGWSYEGVPLVENFEKIGASPEARGRLVENITRFVLEYKLDGVELDWEHPTAETAGDYEKLVTELDAALHEEGKSLTAALRGSRNPEVKAGDPLLISEKCLETFEFISVMAYDMNRKEHSPISYAESSLNYWLARGVNPEKIVLGIPLYAMPSYLEYDELVALDPANAHRDFVQTEPQPSYYNGLETIRAKTLMVRELGGGVMLFDVNMDANDENSVLSMMKELLESEGI